MDNTDLDYEQLVKLDNKSKTLIINLVSIDLYIEILKKQPKKYLQHTKGLRIDKSSQNLVTKIPKIFLAEFDKGDEVVVNTVINKFKNVLLKINELLGNEDIHLSIRSEKASSKDIEQKSLKIFEIFKKVLLKDNVLEYIKLYIDVYNLKPNMEILIELEKISIKESFASKIDLELEKRFSEIELNRKLEYREEAKLKGRIEKLKIDLESELLKNINLNREIKQLKIDLKDSNLKINNVINTSEQLKKEHLENTKILNKKLTDFEEKNNRLEEDKAKNNDIIIGNIKANWVRDNQDKVLKISENEEIIDKLEKRKKELNEYMEDFLSEIDNKVLDMLLKESILKGYGVLHSFDNRDETNGIKDLNKEMEIFEIIGEELKVTISDINEMEDFICDLDDNLSKSGIISSNRMDDKLARYIASTILLEKISLLICGYGARELAASLSMVYCSRTPHIISLPNGYSNIVKVSNVIENSESEVILIENYQGGINDNLVLNLIKNNTTKILLFSVEDINLIKYIPKYMFNYLALLNIDISLKVKEKMQDEEFSCSYGMDFLEKHKVIDTEKIEMKHRKILELLDFSKSTIEKLELGLINYSAFIDLEKIEINNKNIEDSIGEYLLEEYIYIEKDNLILEKLYKELCKNEYNSEEINKVIKRLNEIISRND